MSNVSNQKSYTAWILIVVLSLIWGSSFILMKRGLIAFSSLQVGSLRITIGALVLLLIGGWQLREVPKEKWIYFFMAGCLGSLFPAFLFAEAGTKLPSAISGVLNGLTPVFTFLIGVTFYGQRLKIIQLVGLLISLCGSAGLSMMKDDGSFDINIYALLIMVATLFYGINVNLVKQHFEGMKSLMISVATFSTILPLSLGALLTTNFIEVMQTHEAAWSSFFYVAILGALGSGIALIFFNKLVQMTSPVVASLVTYLIPVVAILIGVWDGETLHYTHFLFMGLIIAGVYVVNKFK